MNFTLLFLVLTRDNLVTTIPTLHPNWELSVDIFPTGTTSGWSNLIHVTTGDNIDAVFRRFGTSVENLILVYRASYNFKA